MLYINEWLPNPVGNDASGEFIELYNSATIAPSLNDYSLSDGAKKKFSLAGYRIPPDGYLVLNHAQTKLTLKNTDGVVLLYGPDGQIVDQAGFVGAAPEGKSFSRVNYSNAPIGHFAFVYPTPGAANQIIDTIVSDRAYPLGVSLSPRLAPGGFLLLAFGVGASFLVFFIYVTRNNRNVSHFIFGGDKEDWL